MRNQLETCFWGNTRGHSNDALAQYVLKYGYHKAITLLENAESSDVHLRAFYRKAREILWNRGEFYMNLERMSK